MKTVIQEPGFVKTFASNSLEKTGTGSELNYKGLSSPGSSLSSAQKRHGAEMLKQKQKSQQTSEALARLKETIEKQKQNRYIVVLPHNYM